jgi:hypothetical protein
MMPHLVHYDCVHVALCAACRVFQRYRLLQQGLLLAHLLLPLQLLQVQALPLLTQAPLASSPHQAKEVLQQQRYLLQLLQQSGDVSTQWLAPFFREQSGVRHE